jgi:hypothetical protein
MSAEAASGYTTEDVAKLCRVSPDRVRTWIRTGQLGAINTADPGSRPRFVILPEHLEAFARRRSASPPPKPEPRCQRTVAIDFYPG